MPMMDHERLTCSFFRRVNSPQLFKLFFEQFDVWDKMGLTLASTNDEIFEAWQALDCPKLDEIREDLCRVNDIGREKGRYTLLTQADGCGVEDYAELTIQKLAMILYLDHRRAFNQAYDFYCLEKTDNLYTLLGDRAVPCNPTTSQVDTFKADVRKALTEETEGPMLKVEVETRHPDKWMAAIPHQHYVKPDHEFNDRGDIVTRDRRPVFEMVLIYYPDSGLLKLKAGRGRKKVELVARAFAEHVLGESPDFFSPCDIINFDPLLNPDFDFAPEPGDLFQWARPVQIKYTKRSEPGTEYCVQVKDMMAGKVSVLKTLQNDGVNLSEINIESLFICFKFPKNRRDRRTVELTLPNRITLDETDRDRYIEKVLMRWRLVDHEAKRRLARVTIPRQVFSGDVYRQ